MNEQIIVPLDALLMSAKGTLCQVFEGKFSPELFDSEKLVLSYVYRQEDGNELHRFF